MTLFKTTIKLYDIGNFHGSQHRFEIIIVFGQICSLIDKLEFFPNYHSKYPSKAS